MPVLLFFGLGAGGVAGMETPDAVFALPAFGVVAGIVVPVDRGLDVGADVSRGMTVVLLPVVCLGVSVRSGITVVCIPAVFSLVF